MKLIKLLILSIFLTGVTPLSELGSLQAESSEQQKKKRKKKKKSSNKSSSKKKKKKKKKKSSSKKKKKKKKKKKLSYKAMMAQILQPKITDELLSDVPNQFCIY